MILSKFISSKTAIISAGIVLAGYIILVLVIINLGQGKLQDSQYNELQLKVNHYADTFSYFFEVSQDNMQVLSQDQPMITFFHNRRSGLSMFDGLGKSLFKLEALIEQFSVQRKINNTPIFNNISLINLNGSAIINNTDGPFYLGSINIEKLIKDDHSIHIEPLKNNINIKLLQLVYLNDEPIAFISAEISNTVIVQQLTAHEHSNSASHLELSSDIGNLFIWDSLKLDHSHNKAQQHKNLAEQNKQNGTAGHSNIPGYSNVTDHDIIDHSYLLFLEKSIKNTPLRLIAWYEPVNNQNLFTSRWFIVAISLLAIPVIWGIYFLIRIDHNNTVLQTEINLSHQQQQDLAIHNYQLEKEISKRKASEKTLQYQASHDSLTGLVNRDYSLKRLAYVIETSKRNHTKILLMYIDLDNFKLINDTLGHSAGDQVLIESSKRLLSSLRKTDTISRLGGDEFLLILPDIENNQHAIHLAAKILALFEQPFQIQGQVFFSSTSIGLSVYPHDGNTPETLLKCADMALYRVKDSGRNSFSFYNEEMNSEMLRDVTINRRLRHAIENNKLEMYYQPLVDLQTGKIIGAEALMRWTDEELGFISPDEFIVVAEHNNLINQLGEFALSEACQQAAQWQIIAPIQIAVNFSSVQFRDCRALLEKIITTLDKAGLARSKLDVEVTESLLINQGNELFAMLAELCSLGIQLSIDDFGTGYSALSYLQKYSFNKLKIDRAFVMHIAESASDRSLVTAIIAMAKALNLKVVAEGIEEQAQADFLKHLGCEYGQGYLFSKPLPADDFEELLLADNSES